MFFSNNNNNKCCHLLRTLLAAATRSYVLASSYMILTRNWPSISSWASLLKTKGRCYSWATANVPAEVNSHCRELVQATSSSACLELFFHCCLNYWWTSVYRHDLLITGDFIYGQSVWVSVSCLDLYYSNIKKVSTVLCLCLTNTVNVQIMMFDINIIMHLTIQFIIVRKLNEVLITIV